MATYGRRPNDRDAETDGGDDGVDDAALDSLPPSALLVLHVIEDEGPLSGPALQDETRLPERSMISALERLREHDLVDSRPNPNDAREKLYALVDR